MSTFWFGSSADSAGPISFGLLNELCVPHQGASRSGRLLPSRYWSASAAVTQAGVAGGAVAASGGFGIATNAPATVSTAAARRVAARRSDIARMLGADQPWRALEWRSPHNGQRPPSARGRAAWRAEDSGSDSRRRWPF